MGYGNMDAQHQNEEKLSVSKSISPVHNFQVPTKLQHCYLRKKIVKTCTILMKKVQVYFREIVFQSWWPDIAFSKVSLFKRKNTCTTFSKPFTHYSYSFWGKNMADVYLYSTLVFPREPTCINHPWISTFNCLFDLMLMMFFRRGLEGQGGCKWFWLQYTFKPGGAVKLWKYENWSSSSQLKVSIV